MPQILSALLLLAISVPPAFAQLKATPIYLKVQLEGMVAKPYEKSRTLPEVQREIAELVIQKINKELSLQYPWDFQPASPEGGQSPQLTIRVYGRQIDSRTDNWEMELGFDGPKEMPGHVPFDSVTLLPPGHILLGRAPDEDRRKQEIYVWFRKHFAQNDQCPLKQVLRNTVPLAKGYIQPQATNPTIEPGMGVVLLREEFYKSLARLRFEWRCKPGGRFRQLDSQGRGWFTRFTTDGGPVEGIVVSYEPQGVDLNGLDVGEVYLKSAIVISDGTD